MKINLVILITYLFFVSCNSKETIKKAEEQKLVETKQTEEKQFNDWVRLSGATGILDTMHLNFSYQYQEYLKTNKKICLKKLRVVDVLHEDSGYLMKCITEWHDHNVFFELKISNKLFQMLEKIDAGWFKRSAFGNSKLSFIVEVANTKRYNYEVIGEAEETDMEGETPSVHLEVEPSVSLKIEGRIVDIYKNYNE